MKKIITLIVASSLVLIFLIGLSSLPQPVTAQNIGSLRSVVSPGFSFKIDLQQGDTDSAVKELQRVLNADVDTAVSIQGTGSAGQETTYFGSLVKAAVIKFQEKYRSDILTPNGLSAGTGFVGKATRTKLNLLIGVMTTSASVGSPQSRTGSGSVTYVAPTTIVPSSSSGMTVCQLVELLINIDAIASSKASQARSVMGCSSAGSPFVSIMANGHSGSTTVSPNSTITLSWTSGGVVSCSSGSNSKTLSGSQTVSAGTVSRSYSLTCRTASGASLSDSVTVKISGTDSAGDENSPVLETNSYSFGSDRVTFDLITNVSTKAYITYRTNSADAQTASFTTLKSDRTETITGLTSSTTYYFKIKIVDSEDNSYTTNEFSGQTLASSTPGSATSTGSLHIYVNGQRKYSTTTDSSSSSYIYPTVSWTSSGYSTCKISSNPFVSNLYDVTEGTNGSVSASIWPSFNQGTTTFTLACATGTSAESLYYDSVNSLTPSAEIGIATATLSISLSTTTATPGGGTTPDASTTPTFPDGSVSTTTDTGVISFGGLISGVYKCPLEKHPTYKILIADEGGWKGWIVYYDDSKLATSTTTFGVQSSSATSTVYYNTTVYSNTSHYYGTSTTYIISDASSTAVAGTILATSTNHTSEMFVAGAAMMIGMAWDSGGPSNKCSPIDISPLNNPLGNILYTEEGYIAEFGSDPDYLQSSDEQPTTTVRYINNQSSGTTSEDYKVMW